MALKMSIILLLEYHEKYVEAQVKYITSPEELKSSWRHKMLEAKLAYKLELEKVLKR